jgi:hypothetical protein
VHQSVIESAVNAGMTLTRAMHVPSLARYHPSKPEPGAVAIADIAETAAAIPQNARWLFEILFFAQARQ